MSSRNLHPAFGPKTWVYDGAARVSVEVDVLLTVVVPEKVPAAAVTVSVMVPRAAIIKVVVEAGTPPLPPWSSVLVEVVVSVVDCVIVGTEMPIHEQTCGRASGAFEEIAERRDIAAVAVQDGCSIEVISSRRILFRRAGAGDAAGTYVVRVVVKLSVIVDTSKPGVVAVLQELADVDSARTKNSYIVLVTVIVSTFVPVSVTTEPCPEPAVWVMHVVCVAVAVCSTVDAAAAHTLEA